MYENSTASTPKMALRTDSRPVTAGLSSIELVQSNRDVIFSLDHRAELNWERGRIRGSRVITARTLSPTSLLDRPASSSRDHQPLVEKDIHSLYHCSLRRLHAAFLTVTHANLLFGSLSPPHTPDLHHLRPPTATPPPMGNNPSKGPAGDVPAGHIPHAAGERKVVRRTSLNAISNPKATAADPSATRETASGHSAGYQGSVQHRLQSRNAPDSPSKSASKAQKSDGRRPDYAQGRNIPAPDQSNPMQVPTARQAAGRDPVAPSGPPLSSYYSASTHLQRPPRMPLPIGDATTTPGSPISGPEDSHIQSLPADRLLDEHMDPGASNLSSATLDGEEIVDELQSHASSGVGKAVSTYIEWSGPGQKVYVTGTFVNWEKKFKLHRRYVGYRPVQMCYHLWRVK